MKLTKFKSIKNLLKGKKNISGRNKNGRIIVGSKGGGHKKLYRNIDLNYNIKNGVVISQEYDPNRTAHIAVVYNYETKRYTYTPSTKDLEVLTYFTEKKNQFEKQILGQSYFLESFKPGQFIHNIEKTPGSGSIFARAAGTYGQILKQENKNSKYVYIKLPSGEQRLIDKNCKALFGISSNNYWNEISWKKAGKSRWLNKRPHVRGVAMNPVDHPHGGGEGKTSGGRPSVTAWGKPAKGQPTRKKKKNNNFILINRKKAKTN